MRAEELETRADERGIPREAICLAAEALRPVLGEALEAASRWRWIHRAGLRAVMQLLEQFQARNCAKPHEAS